MNPFYSLLGLAMRAGKVVSGDELVQKAVRLQQAKLVVIAADASANTKKRLYDKCTHYDIRQLEYGTMRQLGHSVGKNERAALAVIDAGFVKGLERAWKNLSEVKDIE